MKEELAKYRLEDSKEKLASAKILLADGKHKDSVSRSYYAMFSAARALLATKGLDSAKHSGVIALFNQHFVKEEIVVKDCGKMLSEAKRIRERSNYGDFTVITKEQAEEQVSQAEEFLTEIEKTLNKLWKEKS